MPRQPCERTCLLCSTFNGGNPQTADEHAGRQVGGPPILTHKFDVESFQKYSKWLNEGELVVVTEKLHGSNCRVVMVDDKLWVGSRNQWWEEDDKNLYWQAIRSAGPDLIDYCRDFPGHTIYGEAYGKNRGFHYDTEPGQTKFRAFAIMSPNGLWADWSLCKSLSEAYKIPWAPYVMSGKWDSTLLDLCKTRIEATSLLGTHVMEGVVIVPQVERKTSDGRRVALKLVSNRYLMKS